MQGIMTNFVQQNNSAHNGLKVLLNKHKTVALDDLICPFLVFERTG